MSILLLSKTTELCREAQHFLRARAGDSMTVVEGGRGDSIPLTVSDWSGDHIVSFLSPWMVPTAILARARGVAINFHPGPPAYPGIGCYNFALYEGAAEYGVTCHEMVGRVDTGPIVKTIRFPISESDTVATLKDRSVRYLLELFREIVPLLLDGVPLSRSGDQWTRRPFTRRELNDLCRIQPSMADEEIRRRVRATTFPGLPGAYIELAGHRFVHE